MSRIRKISVSLSLHFGFHACCSGFTCIFPVKTSSVPHNRTSFFNNHRTVPCSTVQCSTVQYSTVQYSAVQYSTVQYSTVQCGTVQYSTVQYSTVA